MEEVFTVKFEKPGAPVKKKKKNGKAVKTEIQNPVENKADKTEILNQDHTEILQ